MSLARFGTSAFLGRAGVPLVELFTADEQRARTSQAYFHSAVGDRLRYVRHSVIERAWHTQVIVEQRDMRSGLVTRTTITRPHNTSAMRFATEVINSSDADIVLTAITSLTVGFGHHESDLDGSTLAFARSEWLAENRWAELPMREVLPRLSLALHGQDGRGHFAVSSHGAWSSGEFLPAGMLTSERGETVAWQVETSGPWHWDVSQARDGGVLSLCGPTDLEHQFAAILSPGESFQSVPVAIATGRTGQAEAVAELSAYRRWLRSEHGALDGLPVVYNDFMNTLMGQPSTEALLPLIAAAAEAGAECFCIDAGWYADPAIGDWWATVGEWEESDTRFTFGFRHLIDAIHASGMRSGIWLEPEVVGVESPIARTLPEAAFFRRYGQRVREHDRFQLDFRHPAARAHLDAVVDRLIGYGISYFKLDYNINPGAGTDWGVAGSAAGLLAHTRAFTEWIMGVRDRHPHVSIENCSSGAMRADYGLLAVTQLQSTSDQQDFLLYPPVAASAPATILPEQCGNWAYPAKEMTVDEVVFTLVTGLSGRFYLSGFLNELDEEARVLTAQAVQFAKEQRAWLGRATPFWPIGLPGWDDPVVCLGLTDGELSRLFVWSRGDKSSQIQLPAWSRAEVAFPANADGDGWSAISESEGLVINVPAGPSARVFDL